MMQHGVGLSSGLPTFPSDKPKLGRPLKSKVVAAPPPSKVGRSPKSKAATVNTPPTPPCSSQNMVVMNTDDEDSNVGFFLNDIKWRAG
jgi:hypothetical protein